MYTVYKYPVPGTDAFTIDLPVGARLLSVQVQHGSPFLWALVRTDNETEPRHFRLAGTGHPIEDVRDLDFVGTFQVHGGALVFHLFVRKLD